MAGTMAAMSDPQYTYDDYEDTRVMRRRDRGIRADDRSRRRAGRGTTVRLAITVVTVITAAFAVILGLDILFELLRANEYNALVIFVDDLAAALSLFFHDLFTPDYRWLRILLNDGLAALFWLAVGRVIVMIIQSLR